MNNQITLTKIVVAGTILLSLLQAFAITKSKATAAISNYATQQQAMLAQLDKIN